MKVGAAVIATVAVLVAPRSLGASVGAAVILTVEADDLGKSLGAKTGEAVTATVVIMLCSVGS